MARACQISHQSFPFIEERTHEEGVGLGIGVNHGVFRIFREYWLADVVANDRAQWRLAGMELLLFPEFCGSRSPWMSAVTNRFAKNLFAGAIKSPPSNEEVGSVFPGNLLLHGGHHHGSHRLLSPPVASD
jgi:hypothetical protein